MPYVIHYLATLQNLPCSITLRGIFENGRYYGDVVVRGRKLCFNVEGIFNASDTNTIFDSISFFETQKYAKGAGQIDCWIGYYPIQKQSILFEHSVDYSYEEGLCLAYEKFVTALNNEIRVKIIQNL